jgi:hypothetical protein
VRVHIDIDRLAGVRIGGDGALGEGLRVMPDTALASPSNWTMAVM